MKLGAYDRIISNVNNEQNKGCDGGRVGQHAAIRSNALDLLEQQEVKFGMRRVMPTCSNRASSCCAWPD